MNTIERFAKEYRLRITRDSCNDPIILGRRGHLYFDGPELCLMILNRPVRAKSVLKAIGGKLWTGDKTPSVVHLYRGAPAVRCWSRFQQTDKGISLCAAPLRKDSRSRASATEDPTKVACPYCVELLHPEACGRALVPCGFCTGIITRPKSGDMQDVKITGIPLENAWLAIRLVGARPRRVLSEAQRRALTDGRRPFKSKTRVDKSPRQSLESLADHGVRVREAPPSPNLSQRTPKNARFDSIPAKPG